MFIYSYMINLLLLYKKITFIVIFMFKFQRFLYACAYWGVFLLHNHMTNLLIFHCVFVNKYNIILWFSFNTLMLNIKHYYTLLEFRNLIKNVFKFQQCKVNIFPIKSITTKTRLELSLGYGFFWFTIDCFTQKVLKHSLEVYSILLYSQHVMKFSTTGIINLFE